MDIQEIYNLLIEAGAVGFIIFLSTIIKIPKIEINIWQWIAVKLGNALNRDVLREMEEIKDKQTKIDEKLDKHISKNEEEIAIGKRKNILLFAREILYGQKHTREDFAQILLDVDDYNSYCAAHEGFLNKRAEFAIDLIERNYRERLDKADFLDEPYRTK